MKLKNYKSINYMNVENRERYRIDIESAFVVWKFIEKSIADMVIDKCKKNCPDEFLKNDFTIDKLKALSNDIHIWLRETHYVYDFYFDEEGLRELCEFVDQKIMDILWIDSAREIVKKIWGIK